MRASYEKTEDTYILKLDELKLRIPFVYNAGEFREVHVTDAIMDMLVNKYNNDDLQLTYKGEPVTAEEIHELLSKENNSFKDIAFTIKELNND